MNRDFRLALMRPVQADGEELVIDFTRYDTPAAEPADLTRRWSLLGKINQKQVRPQDRPVSLHELTERDKALIFRRLPELR